MAEPVTTPFTWWNSRKGALAVNAGRQRLPTDAMVAFRFQDLATGLVLKLVIFTDPVVT